jgi:hypothetical protein
MPSKNSQIVTGLWGHWKGTLETPRAPSWTSFSFLGNMGCQWMLRATNIMLNDARATKKYVGGVRVENIFLFSFFQMRKCIEVGRKNGYFCFFWVMGVSRSMLWISMKHVKKNIAGQCE